MRMNNSLAVLPQK